MHQGNTIKKNLTKGFHSQKPRKKLYAQHSTKGQEISEGNFGVFNSPKNRTNYLTISALGSKKSSNKKDTLLN